MEQSARDEFCEPLDAELCFVEFARTKLTPEELSYLGFDGAEKLKADCEPQNSDIRLFKDDWRYGAHPFIRELEAAKMKIAV